MQNTTDALLSWLDNAIANTTALDSLQALLDNSTVDEALAAAVSANPITLPASMLVLIFFGPTVVGTFLWVTCCVLATPVHMMCLPCYVRWLRRGEISLLDSEERSDEPTFGSVELLPVS